MQVHRESPDQLVPEWVPQALPAQLDFQEAMVQPDQQDLQVQIQQALPVQKDLQVVQQETMVKYNLTVVAHLQRMQIYFGIIQANISELEQQLLNY